MEVPLYHPFLDGFSIINQPFWGSPIYGPPHLLIYYWVYHTSVAVHPAKLAAGRRFHER